MSSPERPFPQLAAGFGDQAVDIQRYVQALRRGAKLIAAIAIVVTVGVVLISKSLPKTYRASATIVYNPSSTVLQPTDSASIERQLATFQALAQTPAVLSRAAPHLAESAAVLKSSISSLADTKANIITIRATAHRASLAAARANAVAQAFVSAEQSFQNAGLNLARAQLQEQIAQLRGNPGATGQITALQERISALQINAAGASAQLQIGELASPPKGPSSPRPTLNGLIALFVSLLVGVLIVLGRDQLTPRFATPRELGRVLNLPILVGIPYRRRLSTARRRRALSGIEHEAYDVLQASLRLLGTTDSGQRVVLITSVAHGEGKTTVVASLGRSLARAGQRVLVISGDLRSPTLHEHFGLPSGRGLSDCLKVGARDTEQLEAEIDSLVRGASGDLNLDVLIAGQTPNDPSSLMSGAALGAVFDAIKRMDYSYVLIDSPPILGLSDTQFLARQADDVLLVARLDRVTPAMAEDLSELLDRLRLAPLGVVVVGAKAEISPYYLTEHTVTA
jgi:capsular exopolysaccharide synthesis family protein